MVIYWASEEIYKRVEYFMFNVPLSLFIDRSNICNSTMAKNWRSRYLYLVHSRISKFNDIKYELFHHTFIYMASNLGISLVVWSLPKDGGLGLGIG